MRLFVALELPAPVREALWISIDPLRDAFPRIRWVPQENLHLTLRFLGEVGDEDAAEAEYVLAVAAAEAHAPVARFDGIGGFPSVSRATTLWVGVLDPTGALARLAADVRGSLEPRFGAEGRVWRPHITVARSSRPLRLLDAVTPVTLPAHEVELDRMALIRSYLAPEGPRYERLRAWEIPGGMT